MNGGMSVLRFSLTDWKLIIRHDKYLRAFDHAKLCISSHLDLINSTLLYLAKQLRAANCQLPRAFAADLSASSLVLTIPSTPNFCSLSLTLPLDVATNAFLEFVFAS